MGTAIVALGVASCSLSEEHHKSAAAMFARASQHIKPHHIKQCESRLASYSGFNETTLLNTVGGLGTAKWKLTGPLVPNQKLTCYYAAVGNYGLKISKNSSVAYYAAPVKRVSGWRGLGTSQTTTGDFYWCRFVVEKDVVKIDEVGVGNAVPSGYHSVYASNCGLNLSR